MQSEHVNDPAEPGLRSAERGGSTLFQKGGPNICTHSSGGTGGFAAAEGGQIAAIVGHGRIVGLGGFQDAGNAFEPRFGQQAAEAGFADTAFADRFVAVQMLTALLLAVVEVEHEEAVKAGAGGDLVDQGGDSGGGAQVVAGGKGVTGIETETETRVAVTTGDHGGKLSHGGAESGALPRGVLEGDPDRVAGGTSEHLPQALDNALNANGGAISLGGAGMQHHTEHSQLRGALKFEGEGGDGLGPGVLAAGGQVDEITVVGGKEADAGGLDGGAEFARRAVGNGRGLPAQLAFGEDLQGVGAGSHRLRHRSEEVARDGHVRPKGAQGGVGGNL